MYRIPGQERRCADARHASASNLPLLQRLSAQHEKPQTSQRISIPLAPISPTAKTGMKPCRCNSVFHSKRLALGLIGAIERVEMVHLETPVLREDGERRPPLGQALLNFHRMYSVDTHTHIRRETRDRFDRLAPSRSVWAGAIDIRHCMSRDIPCRENEPPALATRLQAIFTTRGKVLADRP